MRKELLLLGTAIVLAGGAMTANAKPNGWYVGIAGGANWVDDTTALRAFPPGAAFSIGNIEFDTGWVALANVGYRWPSNWRVELEGGYRTNDGTFNIASCTILAGATPACKDVSLDEWTVMGNVFYDFPLSQKWTLSLGAGIGADFIDFEQSGLTPQWDGDTVLAGQLIAQLSYAVSKRLELYADYHYLTLDTPEFSRNVQGPETLEFEVDKHSALIGLRYDLYADEEPVVYVPPPVVVPPPPVKQFIVFFGFNKFNLTSEASAVVREAAATAKSQGSASILVTGHTDTVGSNGYNDKLSMRRAESVKSGLVSEGIAPNQISTVGKGETELLVQTGDGVKEPQNRRATIDLK